MEKKVFIRSIPRATATGISDWVNDASGMKLQKTKIGDRANTTLCITYSKKHGGLATGLHEPWTENGVIKKEADGTALTLQDYYERKFGFNKGYLTNQLTDPMGLRPFDEGKRTYMEDLIVTLNDGTTILDLSEFDDLMRYHAILEHPKVANSEKEWKAHKWPNAEFFIAMESEHETLKYQRLAVKTKAISQLYHPALTLPVRRKAIVILGITTARTTMTEEQIHNLMYEFIDNTTANNGNNIPHFNEIIALLETPKGRIEFESKYLLRAAIDYRVIIEKAGTYTWIRANGPIVFGETYTEAIDTLTNPKKDALVQELKDELKLKMD